MSDKAPPDIKVVVAVGLPGSGKSTALKKSTISSDAIRLLLADDETDQTLNARVFATALYLAEQRLQLGRPVTYIDATNLTRRDRRQWIELARRYDCRIEALWFDTPFEVCLARNRARGRTVPVHILELMAARFVPPSLEESFDEIRRHSAD